MLEIALIDKAYFKSIYFIPNLGGNDWTNEDNIADLNDSILIFSTLYLENLLGEELAELFINAINTGVTLETRFEALKNQLVDTVNLQSSFTGYIYFYHTRENAVVSQNVGDTRGKSDVVTIVSEEDKQIPAWNEMIKKTRKIVKWLEENNDDYPELDCNSLAFTTINSFDI